mgnify:CR=1 FL=1
MAKTRITGFARLIIFLIIFIPLAYFGASYYNGEDPVAKLKNIFGGNDGARTELPAERQPANTQTNGGNEPATFENVQNLRDQLSRLKTDLAIAREELARCKTSNVE